MRSLTYKQKLALKMALMAGVLLLTSSSLSLEIESNEDRSLLAQSYTGGGSLPDVVEYEVNGVRLPIPDWMQVNLLNLPPITESGEIKIPLQIVKQLGYDPSRIWEAGQTADTYMMLGDFTDSFRLQEFALRNISEIVGTDLASLNLKDYELLSWQTAETLTEAIPGLETLPIDKVEPLYDLFSSEGISFSRDTKVGELLQQYESLKDLPLGNLGDSLSNYDLNAIPGLPETPLEKFKDWQRSYINQIPGLNQVPFGLFPLFFGNVGFSVLAQADIVFSAAEHGDPNAAGYFLTGSATGNPRVPTIKPVDCEVGKPCSYIELNDLTGIGGSLNGKRWGSGETQSVKGGFGPLALLKGKEPTGLLPYGPGFKVVMTGVNESEGKAEFGLYFRGCIKIFLGPFTCTAYAIGPVPWFPKRETEALVILSTAQSVQYNPPQNYQQEIEAIIAAAGGTVPCAEGCTEGDGKTTGTFTHPIALGTRVSSPYGWRDRPISGKRQFHKGIDYAAPLGTAVKSVDGGTVIKVSSNSCPDFGDSAAKISCGGQLGNWIDVRHADGKIVRYGHLQQGSIKVREGMAVSQGQAIAGVGSSGWSTGPHLDLRVRDDRGNYENPDNYINR